MDPLPNELLLEIFDYLETRRDICHLALTCKRIHEAAVKVLYFTYEYSPSSSSQEPTKARKPYKGPYFLIRTLIETPHLAQHVKSLKFDKKNSSPPANPMARKFKLLITPRELKDMVRLWKLKRLVSKLMQSTSEIKRSSSLSQVIFLLRIPQISPKDIELVTLLSLVPRLRILHLTIDTRDLLMALSLLFNPVAAFQLERKAPSFHNFEFLQELTISLAPTSDSHWTAAALPYIFRLPSLKLLHLEHLRFPSYPLPLLNASKSGVRILIVRKIALSRSHWAVFLACFKGLQMVGVEFSVPIKGREVTYFTDFVHSLKRHKTTLEHLAVDRCYETLGVFGRYALPLFHDFTKLNLLQIDARRGRLLGNFLPNPVPSARWANSVASILPPNLVYLVIVIFLEDILGSGIVTIEDWQISLVGKNVKKLDRVDLYQAISESADDPAPAWTFIHLPGNSWR